MLRVAIDHDRVLVVHGQALEAMRELLADKSVDMVLTDPPYSEMQRNFGKEGRSDGSAPREALAFPPLSLADVSQLAAEFVRVCRGWIVVCSDNYLVTDWCRQIERAGGRWARTGYWIKTNPMPQMSGDRPGAAGEEIAICYGGSGRMRWNGGGHAACWRGPYERGPERAHPTQKPEWLMQALLGSFAPPGGLVLDPFCGSGTTLAAALRADRLAKEVPVETYCPACAKRRAEEWQAPLPVGLRVIGVDADERWAIHSALRISRLLGA